MDNAQKELLVIEYQTTGEARLFEDMMEEYRSYMQGRAVRLAAVNKLDTDDLESAFVTALWKACTTWKAEKGVPFEAYVNKAFKNVLMYVKKDAMQNQAPFDIVYTMASEGMADLVDPRQDLDEFVSSEDIVEQLLNCITEEAGEAAANAAALRAIGYELAEIAEIFGYEPDSPTSQHKKDAMKKWSSRKINSCKKPVLQFYRAEFGSHDFVSSYKV